MKVDVEGNELKVFKGAQKLLSQKPPMIIVEFNPRCVCWVACANIKSIKTWY